ncbi:MAG: hypothetical protein ABR915_15550 [Thermoguttaceae bacterium]|jgi:hypothetical protein
MNLVGKIFTVFIFLMSVVFMSFTLAVYAVQKNWRLVADNSNPTAALPEGLKQQLEKSKKETKEKEEQKQSLDKQCKTEKDRQDKVLAQLETENQLLLKERTSDNEKIATLENALRDAVATVKAAHETLFNLRAETDKAREDIKLAQAERDRAFKDVIRLTDEWHNAVAEQKRLENAAKELADQLTKYRAICEYFKLDENSMTKEPPPGTSTRIVEVRPPDLVEIALGSDDGIRTGHTLFVIRPSSGGMKYVGKITVTDKISPDRAVCRVVPPPAVPIERGDLVRAKL